MKITAKAIDGAEFIVTIVKFERSEVLSCVDLELSNNTNKLWDFEDADCANPKTKAQKIKDAKNLLSNMIGDYECDNDLI